MNSPAEITNPVSAAPQVYKFHRVSPGLVEQLISIYRTMFPHGTVPDEFYEHVVRKLDEQVTRDEDSSGFLFSGVEVLSRQAGSAWTALSAEARLQALERAEQTPFFQRLRSNFVLYFYSNPAVLVPEVARLETNWPKRGFAP